MGLADEGGVDSLSMRKIADQLAVKAMSLYNHVGGKDEILDGLIELVIAKISIPDEHMPWRPAMRARACSLHDVLLQHPWSAALIESRTSLGPTRLRLNDAVLGSLLRGGFSIEAAYHAFLLLDSYIYGFVLQEVSWPYEPEDRPAQLERIEPQISPDAYPNLVAMMRHLAQRPAPKDRATAYLGEFEFGLDLILDGLEARRDGASSPAAPRDG